MQEPSSNRPAAAENAGACRIARFGPFELNLTTPELRRRGVAVSMRQQSLRILVHLVEHAGTTVSREELQAAVWPSGTFVEFESGLYTAVNQMRHALGDSATKPYFIETVPKVGYRFISPVQIDQPAAQAAKLSEEAPRAPAKPRALAAVWGAALLAIAVAAGWALWNHLASAPPVLDHLRPFTTGRGSQDHAAFSPDGGMLAFDWKSDTDPHSCIYIQRLDAATPVRLSKGAEIEKRPVWSPDGRQIAFLRDSGPALTIVSMPVLGGGESKRAEFGRGATPWFDWSRNGAWFVVAEPTDSSRAPAVVLISAVSGQRRAITAPPAGWRGDSLPSFTADSARIVFRRTMVESGVEDLYEVPVSGGEPKRLTHNNRTIGSFSIATDGGLLLSARWESSIRTLWWMANRGALPVRVTPPAFDATAPALSRDGKHLAFSKVLYDVNILRLNSDGSGPAKPLIDSRFPDVGAQYSPDGRRIAFQSSRSGSDDIWICDSEGNSPVRLVAGDGSALGNPKWSPDGKRIVFEWQRAGKSAIFVAPAEGGAPQKLVADEYPNSTPAWSHDGRFLYFTSTRSGRRAIWRVAAAGGAATPVVTEASVAPVESVDGQFLYYFREDRSDGEVWRRRLVDGAPTGPDTEVVTGLRQHDWGNWALADQGLYYIRQVENSRWAIEFRNFSSGAVRRVYLFEKLPILASGGLAVSPDGTKLLFAQVDRDETNIFTQ